MSSLVLGLSAVAQQFRNDITMRRVAIGLIGANLIAIGCPAIVEMTGGSLRREYNLVSDGSLQERLNYVQTFACAVLLALTWGRTQRHILLILSAVFTAICLDDMFSYHETFGQRLSVALSLPAMIQGLRPQDTGEVIFMALEGLAFLPFIGLSMRQRDALANGEAPILFVCLAALVFAGVGLDLVHVLTDLNFVGYLEDGGEMVAMMAACIVAYAFFRTAGAEATTRRRSQGLPQ